MTALLAVLALAGAVAVWSARRWRRRTRWHRVLHNHSRVRATARHRLAPVTRVRPPRWIAVLTGLATSAAVGAFAGGPVASVVAGLYGAVAAGALIRGLTRRDESLARQGAVDAVAMLAAELRAGQPVDVALTAAAALQGRALVGREAQAVAERVAAAVRVAEASGAPLADLLERLDVHLRAVDRARATGSAQAAGARVSAVLLAAMPVAGVGLGGLIGVDPAPVLLRTRFGAACLLGAVALQLGGLAWATRLGRIEVPA
jgi:tight adherence protein B